MTREEAIFYIKELQKTYAFMDKKVTEAVDMAVEVLSESNIARDVATILENEQDMRVILQNAERPKGECVKATGMMPPEFHGHHCCSECGNFANMKPPFGNQEDLSNFCPNCEADMRGEEE